MTRSNRGPSREPVPTRIGAQEWARLVQECRQDGVEPRQFCQRLGLSLKTFQWWRWAFESGRRRVSTPAPTPSLRPRQDDSSAVVGFLELVPPRNPASAPPPSPTNGGRLPSSGTSGVEIVVASLTVRVDRDFDPRTLRQVVELLGEVTRC